MSSDIKQKLKDLKVLIKSDRRIWAVAAFIGACFIAVNLAGKEPRKRPKINMAAAPIAGQHSMVQEAYRDLSAAFQQDIDGIKRSTQQQSQLVTRLSGDLREHKKRSAGIFETLVDRLEEIGRAIDKLEESQGRGGSVNVQAVTPDAPAKPQLQTLGFNKPDVPLPPPPPRPVRASVVTPGDSACLKLLTGVNAPVDGTPYPVVFKVTCPITGPDGSSLEVGEARIIAAAQGSEADGRVLFRLTDLSIRHQDGRRAIIPVDGWIVGEDGVRGMQGRLIDKLGRLIAATATGSFLAALGDRLDTKASAINVNTTGNVEIDSDDIEFSGTSALTDASNRFVQLLLDRYEKLVPVVEVLSGREVMAVFSAPAEIEILDDSAFGGEGIYAASLD